MSDSGEKTGMSTALKVVLALVAVGGVAALVCCGGVWWFGSKAIDAVEDAMTDDPIKIAEITDSIADISIPADYEPQAGIDISFGIVMQMAVYNRDPAGQTGGVVLMQMAVPGEQEEEQMKMQFRQQMQQQGHDQQINVESSETRTFVIDGEECDFEFMTGTNNSDDTVHQVMGVFQGRGGAAFLMVLEDEEHWDEDAVVQMIESITAE